MGRIRMLGDDLIGKIAAGEVVERPANAVKELVENSLDAGAKRIAVEITEGGIDSFRVTDDGCGIEESDIRMAFERHATSKIRSEADLDALGTLGFRGEALASVAAVSRVTLTTRTKDRDCGIRVKNEGGRITDISEAACAPGTGILVRELFYNVPVRRGFLKKPSTEAAAVTEMMTALILSRPDVSFRYTSDSRTVYHSPGDGNPLSALTAVFGSRAVRSMRPVDGSMNGVILRGYVGIGENARPNRGGEFFFVNDRMLKSPLLSAGLEDACRERVMIGKFPLCVLYLRIPPENVNVNIHPNKLDVRFRFDARVREAVTTVVREALIDRDAFQHPVEMTLTDAGAVAGTPLPEKTADTDAAGAEPLLRTRNARVETTDAVPRPVSISAPPEPVYRPAAPVPTEPAETAGTEPESLPRPETRKEKERRAADDEFRETGAAGPLYDPLTNGPAAPVPEKTPAEPGTPRETEQVEQISALPADLPAPMKIYGALFNTFILIEYADHLLLVDQHAVHERLLFDRMMKALEQHTAGQEMLVPCIVSVTRREMALLEENRDLLEEVGLTAEPFSETEVAVRSVPVLLGRNETAEFLHEAIDELENGRIPGADKKRAAILQQACKHAVKGGEPLTEEVLRSLVEEMIDRKVTPTCPHGRPLVVSISHRELDKKFRRIQD